MSILKLTGLGEIQEALLPPEGAYPLVVLKQDLKKNEETGGNSIRMIIQIDDPTKDYQNIFDYMALPSPGDDEEKVKFKMLFIKRKLYYLGLDEAIEDESLDPTDLVGARSIIDIPVTRGEYDGRPRAEVQWPALPTEESEEEDEV